MKNNKGFSLVAGLLIVLIVAVVGFAGYYVWNENQKETEPDTAIINQESLNNKEEPSQNSSDIYSSGWARYENKSIGLAFYYPKDNRIEENIFENDKINNSYVQIFNYSVDKYKGGSHFAEGDYKIETFVLDDNFEPTEAWIKSRNDLKKELKALMPEINGYDVITKSDFGDIHTRYVFSESKALRISLGGSIDRQNEEVDKIINSFEIL